MTQDLPLAIFLMGPTASGKTDLAIELADKINCDIISVDSALIYRDMNIGTAKPSAEILAQYPHQLVDIINPSQTYSAAEFRQDALVAMAQSVAKGRTPLLVGGTMLYYKTLLQGLATLPSADPTLRAELEAQAEKQGYQALHQQLTQVDPQAAQRIHPNDPQRILRALEVYLLTGITLTEHHFRQKTKELSQTPDLPYTIRQFVIAPTNRNILHQRIAKRFKIMLQQGFIEEVEQLKNRSDLNAELPSMRAVGYRQVWDYLEGLINYETMQECGIIATRQLAKRQFTWLRSWQNTEWFDTLATENLSKLLNYL